MIGVFFGGLWAYVAASATPAAYRTGLSVAAAVITLLLMARLWRTDRSATTADGQLLNQKAYWIAVILEIVAIYAASALLPRLGMQDYFLQVVGCLVGLHFIGLWRATGAPRFLAITTGMCAVSIASAFFPGSVRLGGVGALHLRDVLTGAGNAAVLWSAASIVGRSAR